METISKIICFKQGTPKKISDCDVFINLKPLKCYLVDADAKDNELFNEEIKDSFEKEIPVVLNAKISEDVLHIFLHRSLLLSSVLPLSFWRDFNFLKYTIHIQSQNFAEKKTMTSVRCQLICHHLMSLFELIGSQVFCKSENFTLGRRNIDVTSISGTKGDNNDEVVANSNPVIQSNSKNTSTCSNYVSEDGNFGGNIMKPSKKCPVCSSELGNSCGDTSNAVCFYVHSGGKLKGSQISVLCSPVLERSCSTKLDIACDNYFDIVKDEIERASDLRSEFDCASSRQKYLEGLVENCVNLQILSVKHLSAVKVSTDSNSTNSRDSAYILYNHARLCTLLRVFEEMVQLEVVPPLPEAKDIDFTLLKQPEEWILFWNFVYRFPSFLHQVIEEFIQPTQGTTSSKPIHFPTHSIAKFLHSLAHSFGIYYNRVHVLPPKKSEGYKLPQHMVPVLWARIYLLQELLFVFQSCLKALNIVGPTVM